MKGIQIKNIFLMLLFNAPPPYTHISSAIHWPKKRKLKINKVKDEFDGKQYFPPKISTDIAVILFFILFFFLE